MDKMAAVPGDPANTSAPKPIELAARNQTALKGVSLGLFKW